MFLGCGDLRNALCTVAKLADAYYNLEIHLSDGSHEFIPVRNILLAHIMLSETFDPSDPENIQYLWNLWYSFKWNASTKERFARDVNQLLTVKWHKQTTDSRLVVLPDNVRKLKKVLHSWLKFSSAVTNSRINVNISQQRR